MLFISLTIIQMRATHHFHRGLLLGMTRKKEKEIQRNTLKYFWSFCFSKVFSNTQDESEQINLTWMIQ